MVGYVLFCYYVFVVDCVVVVGCVVWLDWWKFVCVDFWWVGNCLCCLCGVVVGDVDCVDVGVVFVCILYFDGVGDVGGFVWCWGVGVVGVGFLFCVYVVYVDWFVGVGWWIVVCLCLWLCGDWLRGWVGFVVDCCVFVECVG